MNYGIHIIPQDLFLIFQLCWIKWLSQNFDQMAFGEKKHEFGQKKLLSILYFWTLKNNTRNFNFRSKEPSPDLQGLLVRYDYPWKKIHINACKKYFFCQRNRKFHFFVDETSTEAISDTLNLKMWFSLRLLSFSGMFSSFLKIRQICTGL